MIKSIKQDINSLINSDCNTPKSALIIPFRWCRNHICQINTTPSSTVEKVKKIGLALFSTIALTLTVPLALTGITIRALFGTKESVENSFEIDHRKAALDELHNKFDDELDRNWNLTDYFGHIRLLNLDRETARLQEATRALNEVGCNSFNRFSAILGKNLPEGTWNRCKSNFLEYNVNIPEHKEKLDKQHQNQTGCYLSHKKMIEEAKKNWEQAKLDYAQAQAQINDIKNQLEKPQADCHALQKELQATEHRLTEAQSCIRKHSSLLIIEDDNRFGRVLGDPNERKYSIEKVGKVFRRVMAELPSDYDMFYFTSYPIDKQKVDGCKWIQKLNNGYELNAYAVHSRFYDTILNQLKKVEEDNTPFEPVDVEYDRIMKNHSVYVATPPLAFQGGFASNIIDRIEPYKQWSKDEWENIIN